MISIPTPICQFSGEIANKFCINSKCIKPAFICKFCPGDQCENQHNHDGKLESMLWMQIKQFFTKKKSIIDLNKDLFETVRRLEKQIKKLIDYINQQLSEQLQKISIWGQSFRFNEEFEKVMMKIKQEKFNLVQGKQMRIAYEQLKQNIFINSTKQLQVSKKSELQNFHIAIAEIKQNVDHILQKNIKISKQYEQKAIQYFNLGLDTYRKNDFSNALKHYKKAIQYNPKNSAAYNNMAMIYKKQKQLQQALVYYTKAIQCNPKNFHAYTGRGNIYLKFNELQKAFSDFNNAILYDPQYSEAYSGLALIKQANNQLYKALQYYTKAIQYNPKNSSAYNNRAGLYQKLDMIKQALQDYTKSIFYNPNTKYGYINRGRIYRKLNRIKEAEQDQKRHREIINK